MEAEVDRIQANLRVLLEALGVQHIEKPKMEQSDEQHHTVSKSTPELQAPSDSWVKQVGGMTKAYVTVQKI